ncbi:hypothetical protein SDC9_105400 [bioreactor metagenome]|uniref:DinB-like domain-containing protein n=1 Tax=bioreactor metagenome TaxID=1076179 RepID=A0A645AZJ0_9ZZZZ
MTDLSTISKENNTSRNELINFVNSLSQAQLYQELPAGWNVLAVLAHLAFWDQRAITLLNKWQKEGISASPNDTDVVNETTRSFFRVLDPERGKQLVLATAQEIDQKIESMPVAFYNDVIVKGTTVHLNRAEHRRMHIEEIKQALAL